nr:MAG TPA: hypothetical protein [Caudoviricetes sp.]
MPQHPLDCCLVCAFHRTTSFPWWWYYYPKK